MIEWIKQFFTRKEIRKINSPKCSKCALVSTKTIKIEFILGDKVETIMGNCCTSCEEVLSREFNPLWIPPLIFEVKK